MFEEYIKDSSAELLELIRTLCRIPAPSTKEDARAEFCADWFHALGVGAAYIDEAKNVVLPICCEDSDKITVFAAHTDTVFPDTVPLPYREDDDKIYCPGVGDDTASLAVLMFTAKYFIENRIQPKGGVIFVCNSCEEGLGNLRGTRELFKNYSGRIKQFVTLDAQIGQINNACVGSRRFEVEARTEGGHSFGNFGRKNAIHALSEVINAIYSIEVPVIAGSRTTYNVGIIEGGTSVNSIAQNAKMLCEYRSDNVECLSVMQEKFDEIFRSANTAETRIDVREIGYRPCADGVDEDALARLVSVCSAAAEAVSRKKVCLSSASTDCNIPLSMGIPAVCIGVCSSVGAHTREEFLYKSSVDTGLDIALRTAKGLLDF